MNQKKRGWNKRAGSGDYGTIQRIYKAISLLLNGKKRDKLPVSLFKEKQEKEKQKHAVLEMRKMKRSKQESLREGYMLLQANTLTAKRNGWFPSRINC